MNKEEPAAVSFTFGVFDDTGDDEEIDAYIRDSKNKNTVYSTNQGYKRLDEFFKEKCNNDKRNFWELTNEALNSLMCHFFKKACKKIKKNGDDGLYQPDTLNTFLAEKA